MDGGKKPKRSLKKFSKSVKETVPARLSRVKWMKPRRTVLLSLIGGKGVG